MSYDNWKLGNGPYELDNGPYEGLEEETMGEMADYLTEQEGHLLALHENGQCGAFGPCPYCEEEDDEDDQEVEAEEGPPTGTPNPLVPGPRTPI